MEQYDLSCVKQIFVGAAPLGRDTINTAQERIGCGIIRQGYGLTETGPVTHVMPLHFKMTKPHSVGTPIQNTEVKIADIETGESLPVGKEGEVCIRGGNVMKGYLNMPEATRSCLTDEGWFHTGDIGESACWYPCQTQISYILHLSLRTMDYYSPWLSEIVEFSKKKDSIQKYISRGAEWRKSSFITPSKFE